MSVCVSVSHCVSTLSPAGTMSDMPAGLGVPHVAGVAGSGGYLPPGEACYQCGELGGFNGGGAGVPLAKRAVRRRRDVNRLVYNHTHTPLVRRRLCRLLRLLTLDSSVFSHLSRLST